MPKKLTNEEKILNLLNATDKSVRKLKKFAASYDNYIDEAVIKKNDARARQLIKQKIGVNNLAEQLIMLKSNVMLGASTGQVMADLSSLPGALEACKGLLSQSPDFKKVGNSIERLFKDMQSPVDALEKLNSILDGAFASGITSNNVSLLDGSEPQEESEEFKAEYAAMLERVKGAINPEPVTKPASEPDSVPTDGLSDLSALIDEENKKH